MSVRASTICPDGMDSALTSDQYWVCAAGITSRPLPPAPAYVFGKVGILLRITYTGPNLRESWMNMYSVSGSPPPSMALAKGIFARASGVLNEPRIEYRMFQYFSHLGSFRAGVLAGSSAGSLSFACSSISHCLAVTGGLGASMRRPNCLTTSAAESFVQ